MQASYAVSLFTHTSCLFIWLTNCKDILGKLERSLRKADEPWLSITILPIGQESLECSVQHAWQRAEPQAPWLSAIVDPPTRNAKNRFQWLPCPAQETSKSCSRLSVPLETVTYTVSDVIRNTTTPTITLSITTYETHFGASKISVPPNHLASPTPITYRPDVDGFSEPIKNEFSICYCDVSSLDKDMWGDNYIISVSNQGVSAWTLATLD